MSLCVVISSGLPPTRCVPAGGQPCPPARRGRLHHPPPRPRALLHPQHLGIQRFSTDVQSEKQLKTTQRQKEELLAVEHRMKCSFTQAVALPPCPTPRAPLLIKSRISSKASPILLCVTLNLSPAHICRSGSTYSPSRAPPAPWTPRTVSSSCPSTHNRDRMQKDEVVVCPQGHEFNIHRLSLSSKGQNTLN